MGLQISSLFVITELVIAGKVCKDLLKILPGTLQNFFISGILLYLCSNETNWFVGMDLLYQLFLILLLLFVQKTKDLQSKESLCSQLRVRLTVYLWLCIFNQDLIFQSDFLKNCFDEKIFKMLKCFK